MIKVDLLAVGKRPPSWVEAGFDQYRERLRSECKLNVIEVKAAQRAAAKDPARAMQEEAEHLLAAVKDRSRVVALDRRGDAWDTEQFAKRITKWTRETNHLQFLIGGPDGLASSCLDAAHHTFSLSRLTFPHALVRVLIAEQLYRALSLNAGHPYHK